MQKNNKFSATWWVPARCHVGQVLKTAIHHTVLNAQSVDNKTNTSQNKNSNCHYR